MRLWAPNNKIFVNILFWFLINNFRWVFFCNLSWFCSISTYNEEKKYDKKYKKWKSSIAQINCWYSKKNGFVLSFEKCVKTLNHHQICCRRFGMTLSYLSMSHWPTQFSAFHQIHHNQGAPLLPSSFPFSNTRTAQWPLAQVSFHAIRPFQRVRRLIAGAYR